MENRNLRGVQKFVDTKVVRRNSIGRIMVSVNVNAKWSFNALRECGSWYGTKVWNSNDKYRKVIYRCNHKYSDGCKCKTPHINEYELKELFKGFIRTLEKQGGLTHEFDAGIWSSLVQEVVVKAKNDIRFIFKNGFEVRV